MKIVNLFVSFIIFSILFFSSAESLCAQEVRKKELKEADYSLWHHLITQGISEHGKWITYTHKYASSKDTLFVKNAHSLITYAIKAGFNATFLNESKLVCQKEANKFIMLDLITGEQSSLNNVTEYAVAKNNAMLILKQTDAYQNSLLFTDANGKISKTIPNLINWKLNPDKTKLAYSTKVADEFAVKIINLDRAVKETFVTKQTSEPRQMEWSASGNLLAFLTSKGSNIKKMGRGAVHAYNDQSHTLWEIELSNYPELIPTHHMGESYKAALLISEDEKRVFFGMEEIKPRSNPDASAVQVWNTADRSIYPGKVKMSDFRRYAIIVAWQMEKGVLNQITDKDLPFIQLDANLQYAITSNPLEYEPQFKYNGDRDYYINNLETGDKRLFLKAASGEPSDLVASPNGRYLLYFKKYQWWSYNLKSKKHTLLTNGIKLLETEDDDANVKAGSPSRIACFANKDREVYIYDEFDLWKIKTDGSAAERITKGREANTRFKLLNSAQIKTKTFNYNGIQAAEMDINKPWYFKTINNKDQSNGIVVYNKNNSAKPLVIKNKLITDILLTADGKNILLNAQSFNLPPQLSILSIRDKKEKIVHQSNPLHEKYYYGKSELFSFNVLNQSVDGVLLYPSNYNPQKKYPMIVHIYQTQTQELNAYKNPSLLDQRGFNSSNFTTQGYFVCLPNMIYEIGNTAEITSKCINAAVQKIIDKDIIDKDRIGLIGHSYGGYETNAVVTHKNPFRTAISGASYSDLAADYLHVAWDFKTADYRRYEFGQMRMGSTLFEDPERYHKNSSILKADAISIPILLWSGADDQHVDVNHSYKLHMALRRLQKNSVMLIYPFEKHVIQKPTNQIDLSTKIKEWFDYYLNKGEYKPWMTPDFLEN